MTKMSHFVEYRGGDVAHSVRHQIHDPEVPGSSLSRVLLRCNFGQVIYTYVPLSQNSIVWSRARSWGVNRHMTRCTSPRICGLTV